MMSASRNKRVLWSLLWMPLFLIAGVTGKITGKVADAMSGEPLIGVNVIVDGTNMGAATNLDGYYTLIGIPPGQYSVRTSYIAYTPMIITDVKVMVDLTTEINFDMQELILEGDVVTVVAKAPTVRKDVTSTSYRVSAEDIEALQVESLGDLINLQAGVVEGHFRGGRSGEVMYIVDGIPINDGYSGDVPLDIENDMIQAMEVISGTFNAEYGQAMSGIVNIVTKEGQDYFSGKLSSYVGEYFSNHNDVFTHIDDINPLSTHNIQVSLSGPLPALLGKSSNFSILLRQSASEGYLFGEQLFLPSDSSNFYNPEDPYIEATGDGKIVPLTPNSRETVQGKLTFKPYTKGKLNLSGYYQSQNYRDYDHQFKFNPEGNYQRVSGDYRASLQFTHLFGAGSFVTLNASRGFTEYGQYAYADWEDPRYAPIWKLNGTGAGGFSTGGMRMWQHRRDNEDNIGKIDFTSQLTPNQKIGAGVSLKQSNLWLHEFLIYFDDNQEVNQPPDSSAYNNSYRHKPIEFNAYIQDKLELGEMILNAGLRYDYFDPDGLVPENFKDTRRSALRAAKTSAQLSPRVGIAYPITDVGVIHFSYGHFFQVPAYEHLYINPDFEVSLIQIAGDQPPRGRFNAMGNAELQPQKTVSYEIGLKQGLTENLTIDITGFNKDIRDLIGMEVRDDIYGGRYFRFINRDHANVKGITLALEQRQVPGGFGFGLDYTFQVASGNASNPTEEWERQSASPPIESEKRRVILDWDQTHSLNLSATTTQYGTHISVIGKLGSGLPYTRSSARYSNRIYNGERKPMTMIMDLNIAKDIIIGGINLSPYLKISNLLDRKNVHDVYSSSGSAEFDYDMNFQTYRGIRTQEEYYTRPDFYFEPRKIIMGLSLKFGGRS